VVIDALRFDFAYPHEGGVRDEDPVYWNKLPLIKTLMQNRSHVAHLYNFIADPPTTTLQRLKGLTTGTLPTFIEAGSNFGASEITEDNWLQHLKQKGGRWVFYGDDTWEAIYPSHVGRMKSEGKQVLESVTYPSFDVWDLHTVDSGIISHIPQLLKHTSEWDVATLHFLGVDHCGHRYGPNHLAMGDKLAQMNVVLASIVEHMEDDTVLLVMGDHGMDSKGDHGGDSPEELEAALFVYSPRSVSKEAIKWQQDIMRRIDNQKKVAIKSKSVTANVDSVRTVRQVDFVPTLSLLIGLPIPFGNLGSLILEPFLETIASAHNCGANEKKCLEMLNKWLTINIEQVHHYLATYNRIHSQAELATLFQTKLNSAYSTLLDLSDHEFSKVLLQLSFLDEAFKTCQNFWTRFDVPLITLGVILFTFASLISITVFLTTLNNSPPVYTLGKWFISFVFGSLMGHLLQPLTYCFLYGGFSTRLSSLEECFFVGTFVAMIEWFLCAYERCCVRLVFRNLNWLFVFPPILMALGYAFITTSNSFIIHEDTEVFFFMQTFGLIYSAYLFKTFYRQGWIKHTVPVGLFMVLTRLSLLSTVCREEQAPHCTPTFYSDPTSSISSPRIIQLSLIVSLSLSLLFQRARIPLYSRFIFPLTLILGSIYWYSEEYPPDVDESTLWWLTVGNARIIFALGATSCCFWFTQKAETQKTETKNHILLLAPLFSILYLVQKPMGHIQLAAGALSAILIIQHHTFIYDESSQVVHDVAFGILLFFLGIRYFFATGHQATLSSIQWSVGFIGLRDTNMVISFLLVFFNTFGPLILSLCFFPLYVYYISNSRPSRTSTSQIYYRTISLYNSFFRLSTLLHSLHHLSACISMVFTGLVFRRHLMVWKIFLPKLMLSVSSLVVVDVVLILIAWILPEY
jgi:phosphatidylinositol glycan class O